MKRAFIIILLTISSDILFGQNSLNLNGYFYCSKGILPGKTYLILDCTHDTIKVEYFNNYYTDAFSLIQNELLTNISSQDTIYKGVNTIITKEKDNLYVISTFKDFGKHKIEVIEAKDVNKIRNLAYIEYKSGIERSNGHNIDRNDLFDLNIIYLGTQEFQNKIEQKCSELRK